jgi:hypothetical protein
MRYRGYCTLDGSVEWWAFDIDATTRLHLHPSGLALAWVWNEGCWCSMTATGTVVDEARRMLESVPLHLRQPGGATFLPIVNREAAGAEAWQALG